MNYIDRNNKTFNSTTKFVTLLFLTSKLLNTDIIEIYSFWKCLIEPYKIISYMLISGTSNHQTSAYKARNCRTIERFLHVSYINAINITSIIIILKQTVNEETVQKKNISYPCSNNIETHAHLHLNAHTYTHTHIYICNIYIYWLNFCKKINNTLPWHLYVPVPLLKTKHGVNSSY